MKNIKVLIVEDEFLIAETIRLYLDERGHTVVGVAISYNEALQLYKETNPDIVLLDIRLYGEKSGLDFAKKLLNNPDNITPYIMVSSQYDTQVIEEAMLAGASGYVTKPISKQTLWSTVELAVLKKEIDLLNDAHVDLKVGHEMQRIRLRDILYIKSDHVYVKIVCRNEEILSRYTLAEILAKINHPFFLKCNRSYIININEVDKYSSTKLWIDDEIITISPKYKPEIVQAILNR